MPPALTRHAPASAHSIPMLQSTGLNDENFKGSVHRLGMGLIKQLHVSQIQVCTCSGAIWDSDGSVSWGLHSRPATRLFDPKKVVQVANNAERPQLLDPRNHSSTSHKAHFKCKGSGKNSKSIIRSLSFPVPAYLSGHRVATAEHTKFEIHAGSGKEFRRNWKCSLGFLPY